MGAYVEILWGDFLGPLGRLSTTCLLPTLVPWLQAEKASGEEEGAGQGQGDVLIGCLF